MYLLVLNIWIINKNILKVQLTLEKFNWFVLTISKWQSEQVRNFSISHYWINCIPKVTFTLIICISTSGLLQIKYLFDLSLNFRFSEHNRKTILPKANFCIWKSRNHSFIRRLSRELGGWLLDISGNKHAVRMRKYNNFLFSCLMLTFHIQ